MSDKSETPKGTDATTGDEQGIGSGVGSGIDTGAVGGSIDGLSTGVAGTTPTGQDTGGVVPSSGDNTYPRAANGDLTRSDDLEMDAERLGGVREGESPDAG